jgi:hypothetical protein
MTAAAISNEISHEFDLVAEVQRLQAELARLKSLPVVPASDHRRACDARDEALAQVARLSHENDELRRARDWALKLRSEDRDRLRDQRDAEIVAHDETREKLAAAQAQLDTWAGALSAQEDLQARNSLLTDSLRALVRQLEQIGGYSTPEQQAELRCARAVLAEGNR